MRRRRAAGIARAVATAAAASVRGCPCDAYGVRVMRLSVVGAPRQPYSEIGNAAASGHRHLRVRAAAAPALRRGRRRRCGWRRSWPGCRARARRRRGWRAAGRAGRKSRRRPGRAAPDRCTLKLSTPPPSAHRAAAGRRSRARSRDRPRRGLRHAPRAAAPGCRARAGAGRRRFLLGEPVAARPRPELQRPQLERRIPGHGHRLVGAGAGSSISSVYSLGVGPASTTTSPWQATRRPRGRRTGAAWRGRRRARRRSQHAADRDDLGVDAALRCRRPRPTPRVSIRMLTAFAAR